MFENCKYANISLRPPTSAAKTVGQSGIPPPSSGSVAAVPQPKHSMLDKLKLFNKEKHQQSATSTNRNQTQSKRTSSSSGFSSARSERSDSSLSLNDGHVSQIKPPTVSVTGNKAAKNNTKQSKLLLAQMKKEQMKANKADKKERSPARSLNKEEGSTSPASSSECKTSTLNRTKQTTNRFNEKHSAQTSKSNININSNSTAPKTSLIIPPTKTLTSPTGNATLPKPIAAIKGTSKLPQPPSCTGPAATSTPESKTRSNETLKRENSDISTAQSNISANINENLEHTQRSPAHKNNSLTKPTAAATQTESSAASYYANASAINNAKHEQQNLETNTHSSYNNLSAQEPTYINSGRLPPLKSALSPHLRKLDYNLSGHSGLLSPLQSPIRTLSQITQSRPETPNSAGDSSDNNSTAGKYYTVPSKIVGSIIYEEEKPVSVLPMRPLLRGYNSHVTLPTRGTHGNTSHFVTDFCENDIGQGYCSDGDVLRVSNSRIVGRQPSSTATASARFLDIDNGYLSEGGGPTARNGNSNGKHFLTAFRHRTQLPTTIEER